MAQIIFIFRSQQSDEKVQSAKIQLDNTDKGVAVQVKYFNRQQRISGVSHKNLYFPVHLRTTALVLSREDTSSICKYFLTDNKKRFCKQIRVKFISRCQASRFLVFKKSIYNVTIMTYKKYAKQKSMCEK